MLSLAAAFGQTRVLITLIPIFWPSPPPPPYVKCNAFFIVIHIVNFDAFTIFTVEINAFFFSKSPRNAICASPQSQSPHNTPHDSYVFSNDSWDSYLKSLEQVPQLDTPQYVVYKVLPIVWNIPQKDHTIPAEVLPNDSEALFHHFIIPWNSGSIILWFSSVHNSKSLGGGAAKYRFPSSQHLYWKYIIHVQNT